MFFELNGSLQRISCVSILKAIFWSGFFLICWMCVLLMYTHRSVIAGVMWMTYDGGFNVRHTCEHGDGLQSFGWLKHDGVSFGQQDIVDNG